MIRGGVAGYGLLDLYGGSVVPGIVQRNLVLVTNVATAAVGINSQGFSRIRNNFVLFDNGAVTGTGINVGTFADPVEIEQNTVVSLGGVGTGISTGGTGHTVRNNYSGGWASNYAGAGATTAAGNASSGTDAPGTGAIQSVALSTVNFENVTSGTADLRVKAASVLKTIGAARLATILTDAYGTSRADPATVGAYEYVAPAAPIITGPSGSATGNTTGSGTVSTDTASGTLWRKATTNATETDPGAGNEASSGWTSSTVSASGAQTGLTFTGLTTGVAVYPHYIHVNSGARSSVSNGASTFTPSTLATTGSPSAQSGTASTALTWAGSNPSALVSGGIGTKTWTLVSAASSGLSGINSSTGVPSGTLTATPGTYSPVIRCTDSSTAGTNPTGGGSPPQTVDFTLSVTVSAGASGPTIGTQPTNQTARIGATATYTIAATTSGGTLSYQWKFNGSNVGTNSATYARSGVVLGDHGGSVTCDVTDSNGTTTSSAASLTVAVTFSGTVGSQVANTGAAFSLDLSSYFAGGLTRTFSVLSGSLPTGITQVGTTAVFSGTLGAPGSGTFIVRSTDSATNTDQTNSISWTINAAAAGTITTDIFRNWANGSPYAPGYTVDRVVVERISDGLDVLTLTSQALNGSSRLVITNAALAVGGDYMVRTRNTLGTLRGYKKYTAT